MKNNLKFFALGLLAGIAVALILGLTQNNQVSSPHVEPSCKVQEDQPVFVGSAISPQFNFQGESIRSCNQPKTGPVVPSIIPTVIPPYNPPDVPPTPPAPPTPASDEKITICHWAGNHYNQITISVNGLNGHAHHDKDIIPMPAEGCPSK